MISEPTLIQTGVAMDSADNFSYPGDYCCTLYKDNDYQGDQATFCLDDPT